MMSEEDLYRPWVSYGLSELGDWVHLLVKRAGMRAPAEQDKIAADLADADNYLQKMREHVHDARQRLLNG